MQQNPTIPVPLQRNRKASGLNKPVLQCFFYSMDILKKANVAALCVVGGF